MGKNTPNGGSLKDYRILMLELLKRVEKRVDTVSEDVSAVKKEVSAVRTKDIPKLQVDVASIQTERKVTAGIYGAIGGFIPALGVLIYYLWTLNT